MSNTFDPQSPDPGSVPRTQGPYPQQQPVHQAPQQGPYPGSAPTQGPYPGPAPTQGPYPPQQPTQRPHPPQGPYGQQFTPAQLRAAAKAGRPFWKKKRFVLPAGLILLFILIGALGSGGSENAPIAAAPATSTQAADPTAAATQEPTEEGTTERPTQEPEPTKEPEPEPTKNALSDEQQDAVSAAEDYLDFTAFSQKGLIRQLSSDAGSGFSKKDATVAVNSMDIDYNEQAAKAAKSYREFTSFSRNGLIKQLESDAGSGFTHKQAVYGADHSR